MTIRIGTSERDGTFHSQGRALKVLFERRPALAAVEVLASNSASMENALRLDAGEIELGFMASNWIGRAKNGEAPFAGRIDLAMAAPLNAGPCSSSCERTRRSDHSPICADARLRSDRARAGWCNTPTVCSARWA